MKHLLPALLLLSCTTEPDLPKGQYESTKYTRDGETSFSFRLDLHCAGQPLNDSLQLEAYKKAVRWRAWSEVGEDHLPGGKTYYRLEIKKGPLSWEPSCDHPWNPDSIGNVKSVVVWD